MNSCRALSMGRLCGMWFCLLCLAGCATSLSVTNEPPRGTPKAWSIGVVSGSDPLTMSEDATCSNPRFTRDNIKNLSVLFVADPFLIRDRERWLLFFELFNRESNKGEIGVAESADLCHWNFIDVALSEPFHLSYPFVFRSGGEYYMIPETRQAGAIRLYKARDFPTSWRFERDLFVGNFSDSSPVYFQKRWWIFTNRSPYGLTVLYATSLKGPWREHPRGPFYLNDESKARPGGRPIVLNGRLVRFVQDNRGGYGRRLRAMIVDRLTPTEFSEHIAEPDPLLDSTKVSWADAGVHHLAPVRSSQGVWVGAFDGNTAAEVGAE